MTAPGPFARRSVRPGIEPFSAAVTGVGLVTAAGVGADDAWRGVCDTAVAPSVPHLPELDGLPCDFMYTVDGLDPKAVLGVAAQRLMDRFSQLAVIAAREAVADAGLDPSVWDSGRVAVVIGSAHGGLPFYDEQHTTLTERGARRVSPKLAPLSVVNGAASSVAMDLGVHGPSQAVSTACSSGTVAIGTAHQMLRTGACDIVVAGGAESVRSRLLIASACQMRAVSTRRDDPTAACRPFDTHRDGFVVGEGAGLLVMERPEHARARGATVRARVMRLRGLQRRPLRRRPRPRRPGHRARAAHGPGRRRCRRLRHRPRQRPRDVDRRQRPHRGDHAAPRPR